MIKTIKSTFSILLTLGMMLFASCSTQDDITDDIQKEVDDNQPHTCELNLNVTMEAFDGEPPTRASSDDWKNGDKIYLTFTRGTSQLYGTAVYNNGSWTLNYYGSFTEGATSKCTAVYFDNPRYESGSVVTLSENTAIYEDTNGIYDFSGGSLSVVANLSPKTGRIRFAGANNVNIKVFGITHYTSYDLSSGKFTNSIAAIRTRVSSDYTPYIYGTFSDSQQPRLNIITASSGYTRMLSPTVFQKGESGYMDIPTASSNMGWQNSVILKINGVEFTMIPVDYASGNFLLAETETTEALYKAITGSGDSSNLAKTGVYESDWKSFVNKINDLTSLSFRYPSKAEWQFAAKGGNKTKGYVYSGSNIIDNVAWYLGNSNSVVHNVKLLQPNELGFYDMSGNLSEYASDSYCYGGYYVSSASNCQVDASGNIFRMDFSGLRLAMSNN